jgi:serine/threonine-protein kinase
MHGKLEPGHTFGNFEIVRPLGHGATGTVYLARQVNLSRPCALKVLAPELVRDGQFLERFRREGQIAASLRHANIVRIFDLLEDRGEFAIAMDYIQGVELQQLLEGGEKMSLTRALDIIIPIFGALEYAHGKGVVHRDVKPANILIEDESGVAFLSDFSIARMTGADKLTQTGTIIGTPEYMAPEQFDGKDVDGRADLYAATLILYEMLAGINPFRGDTLAEVVKKQILHAPPPLRTLADVPEPVERIILKGLSKKPGDRFQSAAEMRAVLRHFQTEQSTTLITPSPQRESLPDPAPDLVTVPMAETSKMDPQPPRSTPPQLNSPTSAVAAPLPSLRSQPARSTAAPPAVVDGAETASTLPHPPPGSAVTEPEPSPGPWWGWRYLALTFFLYWGCVTLNGFLPIPRGPVNLFRGLLGLEVLVLPLYIVACLLRRRWAFARQASAAFLVFWFGLAVVNANL